MRNYVLKPILTEVVRHLLRTYEKSEAQLIASCKQNSQQLATVKLSCE